MFTRVNHSSKIALAHLCAHLGHLGYPCIDTQMPTNHLASLGCRPIRRDEYMAIVSHARKAVAPAGPWEIEVKPDKDGSPVPIQRVAQEATS
jgi:leucyl/phenylalanyl-tRNA--protein transferase